MTRTRNAVETRAGILSAARAGFAERGFERTTIRSVATSAGVDPSLVMHYFSSKQQLFVESVAVEVSVPDLSDLAPEEVADVLVPFFLEIWSPAGPLLGMVRAAATNDSAAQAMVEIFARRVAPALAPVARDQAELRAALIGSQLIGFMVARWILKQPSLVALQPDDVVTWVRPVIAHYLSTPMPAPAKRRGRR